MQSSEAACGATMDGGTPPADAGAQPMDATVGVPDGTSSESGEVECVDDGGCTACTGPATSSATVSFMTDIQPILQVACGTGGATCHGAQTGSQQNLYLAEPIANADGYGNPTTILGGIVGVPSLEAPPTNLVTAGIPENSFLMHKIDGDMCAIMSDCVPVTASLPTAITTPCGILMPYESGTPLSASERTTIWNWIVQGAQNN